MARTAFSLCHFPVFDSLHLYLLMSVATMNVLQVTLIFITFHTISISDVLKVLGPTEHLYITIQFQKRVYLSMHFIYQKSRCGFFVL